MGQGRAGPAGTSCAQCATPHEPFLSPCPLKSRPEHGAPCVPAATPYRPGQDAAVKGRCHGLLWPAAPEKQSAAPIGPVLLPVQPALPECLGSAAGTSLQGTPPAHVPLPHQTLRRRRTVGAGAQLLLSPACRPRVSRAPPHARAAWPPDQLRRAHRHPQARSSRRVSPSRGPTMKGECDELGQRKQNPAWQEAQVAGPRDSRGGPGPPAGRGGGGLASSSGTELVLPAGQGPKPVTQQQRGAGTAPEDFPKQKAETGSRLRHCPPVLLPPGGAASDGGASGATGGPRTRCGT